MNELPALTEPTQLSRRELLGWTARFAALMAAIRYGFTSRTAQAASVDTSPSQTEPETPVTPEAVSSPELEKALERITILDIGKVENGQVAALTKAETYRLLTGDTTLSDQEIDELDLENPALTMDQRMALWFVYYGGHGASVTQAMQTSAEALLGVSPQSVNPDFIPISEVAGNTGLLKTQVVIGLWKDEKPGSFPPLKYLTTGARVAISVDPPETIVQSNTIASCSFQLGTIEADVYTEAREIVNQTLSFEEVKEILNSFTTIENKLRFSSQDQPSESFIFPVGKGLEHIAAITVESGSPPQQRTYNIRDEDWQRELERREQGGSYTATSVTENLDSEVQREPLMQLLITFDDGTQLSSKEHPQQSDYDYEIQPSSYYLRQEPKRYGTFNPENSHRAENLARLKEFLLAHSETFFVMALGNYGDVLTQAEVDALPENVLFVGQLLEKMVLSTNDPEMSVVGSTIGETRAGNNTIFVATEDFGVEGRGSSFAVPIMSLITSLLFKDDQKPTRTAVLAALREHDCLETVLAQSVGATDVNQFNALTALNYVAVKKLIAQQVADSGASQSEPPPAERDRRMTRRQLFTGAR